MKLNELPLDSMAMAEGLRPWILCESPTFDTAALLHTLNEHIEIDALAERGKLMVGMLATLQ